jgi:signal transduction histidine kinase
MRSSEYEILLVEDEPLVARAIILTLKRRGVMDCSVERVDDLKSALLYLDEASVDAVILDLNLPDSSGVDTFDKIREKFSEVPVVILSGLEDEDMAIDVVKKGAQDYMVKGRDAGDAIVRSVRYAIERSRYRKEARELQSMVAHERRMEAIGVIASGVAHEINTPTQFVGTNLQFLEKAIRLIEELWDECDAAFSNGEDAEAIEEIRLKLKDRKYRSLKGELNRAISDSLDGVGRIQRMVKALSPFSRNSHGKRVFYDVNQAVKDAVTISRGEWKHVAKVEMDLDDNIPPIQCQPEEVCQVLLNLIINASHAIADVVGRNGEKKRAGTIAINTILEDGNVQIRVADTGDGIPEGIRHRIFEPFFTTKAIGSGSGQGLYVSYNIVVKHHGGSLVFHTEPHKGTVFNVSLPVNPGSGYDLLSYDGLAEAG